MFRSSALRYAAARPPVSASGRRIEADLNTEKTNDNSDHGILPTPSLKSHWTHRASICPVKATDVLTPTLSHLVFAPASLRANSSLVEEHMAASI
mmetsp:Transcript_418/g.1183  ORF Transcript_418/g.1183 Transcript_418/m.1183 type:complete len:95 (+) Transcript_418:97-381(+)|eukprot:CAMPEP_0198659436 /NCGR_PEP_ID=MMETSP1467-20131203/31866_1 /TAXON_ID=1462469 /ORGANISM="unid. sp., Strain CCMP2135" /LENGTH=94 /DNA_ID=CAMNT_0044395785 /DNA_START=37 /DNA_END=321 /DNA_ORIENTATION=+